MKTALSTIGFTIGLSLTAASADASFLPDGTNSFVVTVESVGPTTTPPSNIECYSVNVYLHGATKTTTFYVAPPGYPFGFAADELTTATEYNQSLEQFKSHVGKDLRVFPSLPKLACGQGLTLKPFTAYE